MKWKIAVLTAMLALASAGGRADTYDPATNRLTVTTITVGGYTFSNVVVTVGQLISFDPVVVPVSGVPSPNAIAVSVTGSTAHLTNVQVCASVSANDTCGPAGGFAVGETGSISVMASSGDSYGVYVPTNQPAASYCSITSGGSGIFGSTMSTAVVTCW
ncbi:MAG: hypothetical protein Q8O25_06315 [Sulfurisoma sp.]|nr:hypothetical protein [Sulfurisoma sp.]